MDKYRSKKIIGILINLDYYWIFICKMKDNLCPKTNRGCQSEIN
jgi:hypothetical protein